MLLLWPVACSGSCARKTTILLQFFPLRVAQAAKKMLGHHAELRTQPLEQCQPGEATGGGPIAAVAAAAGGEKVNVASVGGSCWRLGSSSDSCLKRLDIDTKTVT
jgi:hypothetical protein